MQYIPFKEELFSELIFQGAVLIDFEQGIIYNTFTQNLMGYMNNVGYYAIAWKYQGKAIHILAHRLIWMAAYGPIPVGMQINHINGVKTDNRLCNLELVTPAQNVHHAFDTGLINRVNMSNATKKFISENGSLVASFTQSQVEEIRRLYKSSPKYSSTRKLAAIYDVNKSTIGKALSDDYKARKS